MSENSALVQPKETTDRWATPNSYRELLAREHAAEIQAASFLYQAIDDFENSDKTTLFNNCRTNSWFVRHEVSGEVRIASNSCKLRWCPMCQKARQNFITSQVDSWFCRVDYPKMITFTLRHTSSPLKNQVDFLYKCFQKFRKRKFVKSRLQGGVWFFQIKKSKDGTEWHPHIHCLVDSHYMDRKKLSQLWAEVTHGSTVIDIRSVLNVSQCVKHIARYCATPSGLVDLLPWDRMELYKTFEHRRLVGSFGTARSLMFRPVKPPDSDQWISIGSWSLIVGLAGEDYRADEIISAWKNQKPLSADSTLLPMEHNLEGRGPPDDRPLTTEQYCFDFYTRA